MTPEQVAGFRSGDPNVFRALVAEYSPGVLGVCRGFAGDADEANDLAQETWLRAFAKRRSYHGGSFPAWLLTLCRRVCLSAARSSARRPQSAIPPGLPDRSAQERLERSASDAELRAAITHALFALGARQREVVIHRLILGHSTRETAVAMNCAEGTVKAALHQALERLRPTLAAHASDAQLDPRPQIKAVP